ncbi:MAG: hypothetical protein KDJ65_30870 [Anaerolineae bacterium]|nr:hypothetical protein [Anaerolineae bacterium]
MTIRLEWCLAGKICSDNAKIVPGESSSNVKSEGFLAFGIEMTRTV